MHTWWKLIVILLVIDGFHALLGQINVPEYFPLYIGITHTYDDGAEATIAEPVLLGLTNVTAYERTWIKNPNVDIASGPGNAKDYYLLQNDSLFWAGHYFYKKSGSTAFQQFDPPRILHVHFSDSGDRAVHAPLGSGKMDIHAALTALNKIFNGLAIVEGYVPGRGDETVSSNAAYLKKLGWL